MVEQKYQNQGYYLQQIRRRKELVDNIDIRLSTIDYILNHIDIVYLCTLRTMFNEKNSAEYMKLNINKESINLIESCISHFVKEFNSGKSFPYGESSELKSEIKKFILSRKNSINVERNRICREIMMYEDSLEDASRISPYNIRCKANSRPSIIRSYIQWNDDGMRVSSKYQYFIANRKVTNSYGVEREENSIKVLDIDYTLKNEILVYFDNLTFGIDNAEGEGFYSIKDIDYSTPIPKIYFEFESHKYRLPGLYYTNADCYLMPHHKYTEYSEFDSDQIDDRIIDFISSSFCISRNNSSTIEDCYHAFENKYGIHIRDDYFILEFRRQFDSIIKKYTNMDSNPFLKGLKILSNESRNINYKIPGFEVNYFNSNMFMYEI